MMQIQHEFGDLNQIRITLGLSQRQLCKLLLVDPSAWTRWNKTGAPPHIYQALKWLVQLRKINPDAVFTNNLESKVDFIRNDTQSKLRELEMNLEKIQHAVSMSVSHVSVLNQENRLKNEIDALKSEILNLTQKTTSKKLKAKPKKKKTVALKPKRRPSKAKHKKTKKRLKRKMNSGRRYIFGARGKEKIK
jgi:hypothetical protein